MSKRIKTSLNDTKKISVSQNFITSQRLIEKIINLSTINDKDLVIEIGAGKGHLTNTLCRKSAFVYAIEIDEKLFKKTQSKLLNVTNLKLIHGDFLKYKLPVEKNYKVFSNIPYFITTQIIDKLIKASNPPDDIWVTAEKGAAKRFMGIPNERKKSLLLKVNWEIEIVYYFKKDDFHPKPSVDSVLLHLSRKENPDLDKDSYILFEEFINHSLKYGLLKKKGLLTKKQVRVALKLAKLPPLDKYNNPTYLQWLCLFKCYQKFYKS